MRILDANFNRGREALRVLEDYARFVLNDANLSFVAKQLRHDLCDCVKKLPGDMPAAGRDVKGDVGTAISTANEYTRTDILSVVVAAAKRLTEALRCLEEYSKLTSAEAAVGFESLRYRAYDLEKLILRRADIRGQFGKVRLYVLVTEELCKLPILEVVRAVLAGGADCVQLRQKNKTDAELLDMAKEISRLCHEAGKLFIMNDRVDIACLADADGVHLGQDDLSPAQARKIAGKDMLIGKSTHSVAEAKEALGEDADYIAVGSIFGSGTKPSVEVAGTKLLEQIAAFCNRPIIAIGGITAERACACMAAGAGGVAVCQAVTGVGDPARAAKAISRRLKKKT
jgi:thiamine-phosphate pyrophosphorylase